MRIAPRAWNGGPTRCRQTSARRQRQEQARRVQPRERGRHWLCAGAPPFYSQARPFLGQPARAATQRVGSAVSAPASHSIAILTPILVHLARSSGRMRNHFAMVILRRAQIGVDRALHRGSRRTASLTPHFAHQQRGSSPCRLTAASSEAACARGDATCSRDSVSQFAKRCDPRDAFVLSFSKLYEPHERRIWLWHQIFNLNPNRRSLSRALSRESNANLCAVVVKHQCCFAVCCLSMKQTTSVTI